MVETNRAQLKDLKEGKLVVIDDEPCKIVSIQKSKPGKHGSAKARVEGISLLSGNKKTLLGNVDTECQIPILLRHNAQVVADMGNNRVQVMDLSSYETYEINVPEEFQGKLTSGDELEIQEIMGVKTITRKK